MNDDESPYSPYVFKRQFSTCFEEEENIHEKRLNIMKSFTKICVYIALIYNSNMFVTSLYWIKANT